MDWWWLLRRITRSIAIGAALAFIFYFMFVSFGLRVGFYPLWMAIGATYFVFGSDEEPGF